MELPTENKRLKEIINYTSNGNVLQFSKEIGVSQPRISRLFSLDKRSNKYPLLSFEIAQSVINKFIYIDSEWLLTGKGEMLKKDNISQLPTAIPVSTPNGIPLLPNNAFAGIGDEYMESVAFNTIEERYVIPLFSHVNIDFMIQVRGNSMYPKYSSGDVVACQLIRELTFFQWHKIYVISTRSQGNMVKRIEEGSNADTITCVSDNPKYRPFEVLKEEIISVALVVGSVRLE